MVENAFIPERLAAGAMQSHQLIEVVADLVVTGQQVTAGTSAVDVFTLQAAGSPPMALRKSSQHLIPTGRQRDHPAGGGRTRLNQASPPARHPLGKTQHHRIVGIDPVQVEGVPVVAGLPQQPIDHGIDHRINQLVRTEDPLVVTSNAAIT